MARYAALLRGINVGGKGIVKMPVLKAAFEKLGYTDVTTFIQSGNVLFSSTKKPDTLAKEISAMLAKEFKLESRCVVLSAADLDEIVKKCPPGFGKNPDQFRYDVLFLMPPIIPKNILGDIPVKEGVDTAFAGKRVLYFSRLTSKASQSRLSRVMSMPVYKDMTIRNWNTTVRLAELLNASR